MARLMKNGQFLRQATPAEASSALYDAEEFGTQSIIINEGLVELEFDDETEECVEIKFGGVEFNSSAIEWVSGRLLGPAQPGTPIAAPRWPYTLATIRLANGEVWLAAERQLLRLYDE